jgi:hypothetical protein
MRRPVFFVVGCWRGELRCIVTAPEEGSIARRAFSRARFALTIKEPLAQTRARSDSECREWQHENLFRRFAERQALALALYSTRAAGADLRGARL